MPERPMIAWTMAGPELVGAGPDIAVYADGRVVLAPRFGAGEQRLSKDEIEELRRFLFEEQRLLEIDPHVLQAATKEAAASHEQRAADAAVEIVGSTMDAGTTVIRASDGERSREISYHDLANDAQRYPEVGALQRLRAVELRLLELADRP